MPKYTISIIEEVFKSDNEEKRKEKLEELFLNIIKKSSELEDP